MKRPRLPDENRLDRRLRAKKLWRNDTKVLSEFKLISIVSVTNPRRCRTRHAAIFLARYGRTCRSPQRRILIARGPIATAAMQRLPQ